MDMSYMVTRIVLQNSGWIKPGVRHAVCTFPEAQLQLYYPLACWYHIVLLLVVPFIF